jgi:uncharacterized membrane protein
MQPPQPSPSPPPILEAGIRSVAGLEQNFAHQRTAVDRIADAIGTFTGSFWFVALHAAILTFWFCVNTGVLPVLPRFDPYPFILLCMIVSVEGVILSTFVLMKQNRMQQRTENRDHLNLQIDLLSEKEITKLLQMMQLICHKLEIPEAELDTELQQMSNVTSVDILSQEIKEKIPPAV